MTNHDWGNSRLAEANRNLVLGGEEGEKRVGQILHRMFLDEDLEYFAERSKKMDRISILLGNLDGGFITLEKFISGVRECLEVSPISRPFENSPTKIEITESTQSEYMLNTDSAEDFDGQGCVTLQLSNPERTFTFATLDDFHSFVLRLRKLWYSFEAGAEKGTFFFDKVTELNFTSPPAFMQFEYKVLHVYKELITLLNESHKGSETAQYKSCGEVIKHLKDSLD